jgi:hypothetical protein
LKVRATGSVIDALEPEEIDDVMIPLLPQEQRKALDADVVDCWNMISESIALSDHVKQRFEAMLCSAG